jgi:hypothetical protein
MAFVGEALVRNAFVREVFVRLLLWQRKSDRYCLRTTPRKRADEFVVQNVQNLFVLESDMIMALPDGFKTVLNRVRVKRLTEAMDP